MPGEPSAVFWITFESRFVIGIVEVRGVPNSDASFLRMDGFVQIEDGWRLTEKKGLMKRWEDRTASALLKELWKTTTFYDVTRWWAGNDEAYAAAEPYLKSQMRRLSVESQ
ncbi:hypothetical protein [Deinococcus aquaedulcis]|uniref:hypothetical protein n=1 Tax=Deinococcus aquaedulcis TaxID=2840455 RepID=UPI001C83B50C|nr:hypothetical protein [Deinococcus aquaedulcis]